MTRAVGLTTLVAAGMMVGCGGGSSTGYFPLRKGTEWTYRVRSGFDTRIEPMRVVAPIAVSGGEGWKLVGPMGESRLAWREGVLLAEQLPGTRFAPALPLLRVGTQPGTAWQGFISTDGQTRSASADLVVGQDSVELAGRSRKALRSTVTVQSGPQTLVLDSWFVNGTGLVRQEFRRGGRLVRALDWVAGP